MDASFVAINVAYALYVVATLPRHIIPLRATLILASTAFVVYGLIDDNSSVIWWNAAFGVAQLVQLIRAVRARGRAELNATERAIHAKRFSSMTERDFLLFWSVGEQRAAPDEELMRQGEPNEQLALILEGSAAVIVDDIEVAQRGPQTLLGEISFLTGAPASATVQLSHDAVIRWWTHESVEALTRAEPTLGSALQNVFARELSRKVTSPAG